MIFKNIAEGTREKYIHQIFIVGVLLKALDGALEILGGVALLFPGTLTAIAQSLILHELIEDPNDFLALHLEHYVPFLGQSSFFASIYLLSHGIVKVFLVVGLLRERLWAYPAAIIVFFLFIVYQLYRFAYTHSVFLIILTILDAIVIWLTWHEYRFFKKRKLQLPE
jgi:uncharacterized membrane protein